MTPLIQMLWTAGRRKLSGPAWGMLASSIAGMGPKIGAGQVGNETELAAF